LILSTLYGATHILWFIKDYISSVLRLKFGCLFFNATYPETIMNIVSWTMQWSTEKEIKTNNSRHNTIQKTKD